MRAIDADDFGNRMYHEVFEKDTDMQKWDSGCWVRYKLFENVLREQPTIEPERKKGMWILVKGSNGKDYHKCSECLHTQEITGVKNYCAVCGADMREDAEEAKKCDTCKHEKEPWSMQCHRCENYNLWEGKQ